MSSYSSKYLTIRTSPSVGCCGAGLFGGLSGSFPSKLSLASREQEYLRLLGHILNDSDRALWATFDALTEDAFWADLGVSRRSSGTAGEVSENCSIEDMCQTLEKLLPEYVKPMGFTVLNPNTGNAIGGWVIRTSLVDNPEDFRRSESLLPLKRKVEELIRERDPDKPKASGPTADEMFNQLLELAQSGA